MIEVALDIGLRLGAAALALLLGWAMAEARVGGRGRHGDE